jgi:hypothetical protein
MCAGLNIVMNYKRLYDRIIDKSTSFKRKKGDGNYYERHHIIPRAIGGSDTIENFVLLTAKEHFVCHHLLTKFTTGSDKMKMCFAFWAMCNQLSGDVQRHYKVNAATYQYAKQQFAKSNSKKHKGKKIAQKNVDLLRERMIANNPMKGRKGSKNPLFGLSRPEHVKQKIREAKAANKMFHPTFKGVYLTPAGNFLSACDAAKANNLNGTTILKRCTKIVVPGWGFIPKQQLPPTLDHSTLQQLHME